jgi:hypothetical protein
MGGGVPRAGKALPHIDGPSLLLAVLVAQHISLFEAFVSIAHYLYLQRHSMLFG